MHLIGSHLSGKESVIGKASAIKFIENIVVSDAVVFEIFQKEILN